MNSINLISTVRDILGGGDDDDSYEINDICYLEKFSDYHNSNTGIFYYTPGIFRCGYDRQTYLKERMETGKGSVDISASGPSSGSPSDPVSVPASGSSSGSPSGSPNDPHCPSSGSPSDPVSVPASGSSSDAAKVPVGVGGPGGVGGVPITSLAKKIGKGKPPAGKPPVGKPSAGPLGPDSGSSSGSFSSFSSVPASDAASSLDSDDASVIISNGNIPVKFSNNQPIEKLMCNNTFFEEQESLGCGRHALNNLLGGKYFINEYDPKIDINKIEELPGKQPIALQTICRYLKKLYSLMDDCPDDEYYDINTLMFALALYGFVLNVSNQYDRRHPVLENRKLDKYFDTVDEKNLIGFIIHFPGHWACVRKESSNYRYFDSLGMYHKTTYTKENLVSLLLGTYMDYMCQVHYNGIIIDRTEIFKAFVS